MILLIDVEVKVTELATRSITLCVVVQPLASVTDRVYVPAIKPEKVALELVVVTVKVDNPRGRVKT